MGKYDSWAARCGWFSDPGAYVLVDGQFGSTGKGLLASFLAAAGRKGITHVTTNAGPNSGHTAYFPLVAGGSSWDKVVTQQVPIATVLLNIHESERNVTTLLNAGAIINDAILNREYNDYNIIPSRLFVHPCAAWIDEECYIADQATVDTIASTGKGIGPALARKILRQTPFGAVAKDYIAPFLPERRGPKSWDNFWDWKNDVVFVETAQGFSLGINSSRFYPHTTSRECTVQQAIADARIPHNKVRKVVACYRTYPIRVGNTANGHSGEAYPDQTETTWMAIGVTPELTTVTQRVRRVFTWSRIQFMESVAVNQPDVLFLNFCNYLKIEELDRWIIAIRHDYRAVMGKDPDDILLGFGPRMCDLKSNHGFF